MKTTSLAIAVLCLSLPAVAQVSSRGEAIQRVVEGLSSADPVARIMALEEAMSKGDQVTQRVALDTVFAGSDETLHAVALENLVARKSSYVVKMKEAKQNNARLLQNSGGSFTIQVHDYNPSDGTFLVSSTHSAADKETGKPSQLPGQFSGNRMSFQVNLANMYNLPTLTCFPDLYHVSGTSVMAGDMSCNNNEGVYSVEIDLRN